MRTCVCVMVATPLYSVQITSLVLRRRPFSQTIPTGLIFFPCIKFMQETENNQHFKVYLNLDQNSHEIGVKFSTSVFIK